MYTLIILFFASLLGMIFMLGRKLVVLQQEPVVLLDEQVLIESKDFKELKHIIVKKSQQFGYIVLVEIIRFSVRSSKVIKKVYHETKTKINKKFRKNKISTGSEPEKREASSFLKKVSEYKHKLKKIKHKVIEEEKEKV